jgi:hypothetical protein
MVIVLLLVLILVVEILELVVMVHVGEAVIGPKVSVIRLHTRESGINIY